MNFIFLQITLSLLVSSAFSQQKTLFIQKKGTTSELIIGGKPFLIRGGELANSSASNLEYMQSIWPTLDQMNLNTILAPVYWELIEPVEGKFDFKLVDGIINQAREHQVKLVFLWFGSWKNSMSCYAPSWVKSDTARFPRALDKTGRKVEILSPFSEENLKADKKAFCELLMHIKKIDATQQTVIMVQVENETAMLPNARDYSVQANQAYAGKVPEQLLNYLTKNEKTLQAELLKIWAENGKKQGGTWSEVFGNTIYGEEIFQAWFYACFTEELTKAGKQIYNLPMYVNAALNRPGKLPGEYPSAGPLPHLTDVWKAGSPSLDMLSPDIYFPDFTYWASRFYTSNNPLFIPEARFEASVGNKMFYAIGRLQAMGFSPFSIESTSKPKDEPVVKAYHLIRQLEPMINDARGTDRLNGFFLEKAHPSDTLIMAGFRLIIKHDYTLGWSPDAKNEDWPTGGGIIIATGDGEFTIAGTGFVVTFQSLKPRLNAGIDRIDEGVFENGSWKPGRRLNGDEDHQGRHLRIPMNEYGIQKIKLYEY